MSTVRSLFVGSRRSRGPLWRSSALAAAAVLVLGACGQGDGGTEPEASADGPCTIDPDVTLNFINAGGAESDAIQAGFIDPFTERTGVEVRLDPPNDLGRLQAMVAAGEATHDLFSTESTTLEQAKSLDLLEPLDYDSVDMAPSREEALDEFAFGFQYYSTIMAWRPEATNGDQLTTWADFFDTGKYPGRRALADYPAFTVPIALLADGVDPEELYPLDIDRAFAFLEEHASDVAVWWEAGAQPPELLAGGEVDFSMVWSGRIVTEADDLGLTYTFDDGLLDLAYIGIPKGAPHYCEAMAFLQDVSDPQNQARAAEILPYTGPAEDIDQYLPQDDLGLFPTSAENLPKQVLQDPEWWFENGEEVQLRWEEFKLSR